MKRIFWWALLGVVGTAAGAGVVGQTVWGQAGVPLPIVGQGPNAAPRPLPEQPQGGNGVGAPLPKSALSDAMPVQNGLPPITTQPSGIQPSVPQVVSMPASTKFPAISKTPAPPQEPMKSESEPAGVQSGRQQPSVSLEWNAPPTVRINQAMSCQLLVRNTSTASVSNVVVRQKLPAGVICKASDPQAAAESGELVWNLGTLGPDQTRRIDLQLVAQNRGTLNCQATVTFTGFASHQVQVREPQLAIKMRAPEKVIVDEPVVLLFAVSNPGDGLAEAVKVKVTLPEGVEFRGGKIAEVVVGNLAPRDIRTMKLECIAKGDGIQKCVVVATADGGISANDTASFQVLVPKLDVAVAGPKLRYLDRPAVYVVKVTNPGSAPASNVEVQEVLPAGFKFTQANHGGRYQDTTRTVSWSLGEILPGQAREISVEVVPTEAGEHRLSAQARTGGGLKKNAEMRTLVEGLPSLLIELANSDNPVEVGVETAYELRLVNTGTKAETGIEVSCTLPEQFEFKGAKCNTTLRYQIEGSVLTFEPLAKLAPKADVIYRIQVRGISAGDVRFRARIKSDGLREPVVREERTRIYRDDTVGRPSVSSSSPLPTSIPTPNKPAAAQSPIVAPAPTAVAPVIDAPKVIVPNRSVVPEKSVPAPVSPEVSPGNVKSGLSVPSPAPALPTPPAPNGETPISLPSIPAPTIPPASLPVAPAPVPAIPLPSAPLAPAAPTPIPLPTPPAPGSTPVPIPAPPIALPVPMP